MTSKIEKLILEFSGPVQTRPGKEYIGIDLEAIRRVSSEAGVSLREAEIAALNLEVIPIRYFRNIASLKISGQMRLLSSSVAVVGAGGLGGVAIELLARLGIGKITIIDGDRFREDNLNRQLLCREEDLGCLKAEAAAFRVGAINSAVEVTAYPVFLNESNALDLLRGSQVVVDALDRISIRILLEKSINELEIPLVHGAIGGFLGEVTTILPQSSNISSLFVGEAKTPDQGVEVVLGTPPVTPAIIAALEVMEVIKLILGKGVVLKDELLYLELENSLFSRINLKK